MNKSFDEFMQEIKSQTPAIDQERVNISKFSHVQIGLLLDIVQKLSLAKDLETIMFIVRKAARQLTGSDGATFVLRDGDKCYYADEDAIAPLWKGKRFPLETCISGWAMQHKQSVVIEDIYTDKRIPIDAYRVTFVKSLVMVPIRAAAPIGAIGTYWAEKYCPTQIQVDLLKALADSTSIAMENIDLLAKLEKNSRATTEQVETTNRLIEENKNLEFTLQELNKRNEEMLAIKELSSKLQACLYLEEAYQLVSKFISKVLPDTAGVLYLMDPVRHYLESLASWGEPLFEEKVIDPSECLGLRHGAVNIVNDPQNELVCDHYTKDHSTESYACFPLLAHNGIVGLLYVVWKNNKIEENQTKLVSHIVEQITFGISNVRLHETLRNQSLRDELTNLYNRHYFEATLERDLIRCASKSVSLALIMIDIDQFKKFNDSFGHEAGDIVLLSLASILHDFTQVDNFACRYGGGKFMLVLPEINSATAIELARELHEKVSQTNLKFGNQILPQITISSGIALFPLHGKNINDLISAADMALYQAKKTGSNKCVWNSQEC